MNLPFKLINIITRKRIAHELGGQNRSVFENVWVDFAELKEYNMWDDSRHINWPTSLRLWRTFVNMYEEDRSVQTLFCVDTWLNMRFGSGNATKLHTAYKALELLAFSATAWQNPVATLFTKGQQYTFTDSKKGTENVLQTLSALQKTIAKQTSTVWHINDALDVLYRLHIKNRLIFFIGDSTQNINLQKLRAIAAYNECVFLHVSDTFENELTSSVTGILVVSHSAFAFFVSVSKKKRLEYVQNRKKQLADTENTLAKVGVKTVFINQKTLLFTALESAFSHVK